MQGQGCENPAAGAVAKQGANRANRTPPLARVPATRLAGGRHRICPTTDGAGRLLPGPHPLPSQAAGALWDSTLPQTRKRASYACAGGSRGKPRWTPEAFLTCKSIVTRGYRGERPIALAGSWFRP